MSKVQWEVHFVYSYGFEMKSIHKTRAEARAHKKNILKNGSPQTITTADIYKVTILPGLSKMVQEGVYTYKKVR